MEEWASGRLMIHLHVCENAELIEELRSRLGLTSLSAVCCKVYRPVEDEHLAAHHRLWSLHVEQMDIASQL